MAWRGAWPGAARGDWGRMRVRSDMASAAAPEVSDPCRLRERRRLSAREDLRRRSGALGGFVGRADEAAGARAHDDRAARVRGILSRDGGPGARSAWPEHSVAGRGK